MNIKQAKKQIKDTVSVYLEKNEFGGYVIPVDKQRPVFLMGAPGIGKTAIMEQIAAELDIALVSYSMTHHTRQSALGLPFIVKKNYGGKEYSVSEYTMSEIIASVYETIENSGRKEGILFLDEINCVSETLAPSMLQFLQFKTFGRHKVPEGWIVVTAGNPPEYNNSVREFDIVTWDRMKRIDVDADFSVWKEYAYTADIHPSILTYLEIKKNYFYKIESSVDGKKFVTARGWEDLSRIMTLYEKRGLVIDESLIAQYIQHNKISKDFAIYYDLFNKYKSDYQVDKILAGKAPEEIKARAKAAKFDERLALLGLIIDAISANIRDIIMAENVLTENVGILSGFDKKLKSGKTAVQILNGYISEFNSKIETAKAANALTEEKNHLYRKVISMLEDYRRFTSGSDEEAFEAIKKSHNEYALEIKARLLNANRSLTNVFAFLEEVFGAGNELLLFTTELTVNKYCASFVSKYGCKEYYKYSKQFLIHERHKDINDKLGQIDSGN